MYTIYMSYSFDLFLHPEKFINSLEDSVVLEHGMTVADLGAGIGHFAIPLSRSVGDRGKVYAVEIQKEHVHTLTSTAQQERRNNVTTLWGDIERLGGTKIPDKSCDVVLLINTLFLIQDKKVAVQEIKRILKKSNFRGSGKVVVVDWSDTHGGVGPAPAHVYTQDQTETLFTEHGFTVFKSINAGSHHYGTIFSI